MGKNRRLKYILVSLLPENELEKLKTNLIKDTDKEELEVIKSDKPWEIFDRQRLPVEECLFISGSKDVLTWAEDKKIPTVGYQPLKNYQMENPEKISAAEEKAEQSFLQADMIVEGFDEIDYKFLLQVWQRYYGIPWTIFTTERCIVREFEMSDLDALFELYAQPEMTEYMEGLYSYEEEKEYQSAYIDYMYRFFGYGMWLVFEKAAGKLIGRAGIEHREELDGELELGYAIHPDYQRKGYATEVCVEIIKFAFNELGFDKICCLIEKENVASRCFAEHIGFIFEEEITISEKQMLKYFRKS